MDKIKLRCSFVINFYLDNVLLITVIIVSLAISIPILGVFMHHQRGSVIADRLHPKDRDFLASISSALLIGGLLLPIVIAFLIKIIPNFIEELAPKAGYFIIALSIWLISINIRRFKFIKKRGLVQSKSAEETLYLEEKINKYRFDMIIVIILIFYMAILFNVRSF